MLKLYHPHHSTSRSINTTLLQRRMIPTPSRHALHALRFLAQGGPALRLSTRTPQQIHKTRTTASQLKQQQRTFTTTPLLQTTLNQVRKAPRKSKKARRPVSPAMVGHPAMKGVTLKVGITKPKKPNSGQRKTAKVRLSSGKVISAYIPGEGHNVQQHSVVMVRGGRTQDCPGVRYHLVRGAFDVSGVPNKVRSRSKYGTKKPKTA